jgi:tetratricopeptide (TPR) repeat protein
MSHHRTVKKMIAGALRLPRAVRPRLEFKIWHAACTAGLAVLVGLGTHYVTGGVTWPLVAVTVGGAFGTIGLALWQGHHDHEKARKARDLVLGPLRGSPPDRTHVLDWLLPPHNPSPVWGRDEELALLRAWCADSTSSPIRIVSGPPGVGKTRLALALADSLPAGWAAGQSNLGVQGLLEKILDARDPTLVIVDDAEFVSDLFVLIEQAFRHPENVRILVCARNGEKVRRALRRQITDAVAPMLSNAAPIELTHPGEDADNRRWLSQSALAYARKLNLAAPRGADANSGVVTSMAILHARALLLVIRSGQMRNNSASAGDIATDLLERETSRWLRNDLIPAAWRDSDRLEQVVALLTLFGPAAPKKQEQLLKRITGLQTDSAQETRANLANWARANLTAAPDGRLVMQPSFVSDYLRLKVFSSPEGSEMLKAIPRHYVLRVFENLVRGLGNFPDTLDVIDHGLNHNNKELLNAILGIFGGAVASQALDELVASKLRGDPNVLQELINCPMPAEFPLSGLEVRRHAVAVFESLASGDEDRFGKDLAESLSRLGALLGGLGQAREAAARFDQEISVRRKICAREASHLVDLARSLDLASKMRTEMGDDNASLPYSNEAVELWRSLAESDPQAYSLGLARALTRHAEGYRGLGDYERAGELYGEAIEFNRMLDVRDIKDRKHLVQFLQSYSGMQAELGNVRESLDSIDESIGLLKAYEECDGEDFDPHWFPSVLAGSLSFRGQCLAMLGRVERSTDSALFKESAICMEEALQHQRKLIKVPSVYQGRDLSDLAAVLINYSGVLNDLTRHQDAVRASAEAVRILTELSKNNPDRYNASLGVALGILAYSYRHLDKYENALNASMRALAISRRLLAEGEGEGFAFGLVHALKACTVDLMQTGREIEALDLSQEAVDILRTFYEKRPNRFVGDLALGLLNLGVALEALHRRDEAIVAQREAVDLCERAAALDPDGFGSLYRYQSNRLLNMERGG